MNERYGTWVVGWDPDGVTIRTFPDGDVASFAFAAVILPVAILGGPHRDFRAAFNVDHRGHSEVLAGASEDELKRFKRRLSGEVLAAVKRSAGGCSDCAFEAGRFATAWTPSPCPTCRQSYCGSVKCLRRLKVVIDTDGRRYCKFCGTPTAVGDPARRLETSP